MPYPNAPYMPPQPTPQMPPWLQQTPQGGPPPVAGMGLGGPTGIPGDMAGGMPPGGMPQGPGGPPGANPGQVDPATAQAVLGVGSNKIEQQKLKQQYDLANALRADAKDQMSMRGSGRIQTAPGWANAAASLADSYMAKKTMGDATAGTDTFEKKKAGASKSILARMGLIAPSEQDDDDKAQTY